MEADAKIYGEINIVTDIYIENPLKNWETAVLSNISAYDGLDTSFFSYLAYQNIGSPSAYQRTVLFAYEKQGDGLIVSRTDGVNKWGHPVYTDYNTGFRMIEFNGEKMICVAVPISYGNIGDVITVRTDTSTFNAVIGDAKAGIRYYHTGPNTGDIPDGEPVCVVEFINEENRFNDILAESGIGKEDWQKKNTGDISTLDVPAYEMYRNNGIVSITNKGSILPPGAVPDSIDSVTVTAAW